MDTQKSWLWNFLREPVKPHQLSLGGIPIVFDEPLGANECFIAQPHWADAHTYPIVHVTLPSDA